MNRYKEGYIFRVRDDGKLGWLSERMFAPHTRYVHHGLVSRFYRHERGGRGDYMTVESIGKGVTTGRLYEDYIDKGKEVQILRHTDPKKRAYSSLIVSEATRMGDIHYDYLLCAYLIGSVIWKLAHFKKPPYTPEDFRYRVDGQVICTELVAESAERAGTLVNMDLRYVPPDLLPFPCLFERALIDGTLEVCGHHRRCSCGQLIHLDYGWRNETGERHWCDFIQTTPLAGLTASFEGIL